MKKNGPSCYVEPAGYGFGNRANLPKIATTGQRAPIKGEVGMGAMDKCGSEQKFNGGTHAGVQYVHGRQSYQ